MGRKTLPLSDRQIKNAKPKDKAYRLYDGGGLTIEIKPNGRKVWRLRYRFNGREKTYTIGDYPSVTLSMAREVANSLRAKIQMGIDPVKEKCDTPKHTEKYIFSEIVEEFLQYKEAELSPIYFKKIKRWIEIYILPYLKQRYLEDITKGDVVDIVKNVKTTITPTTKTTDKTEVSRRVFNILRQIFTYALHSDYTDKDPTAQIDISKILPKHTPQNFKAVTDPKEIQRIYALIVKEFKGYAIVGNALRFLALTALRPGNVANLKWEYVDMQKKAIVIPAEVMKMRKEFRLPLTDGLIDILDNVAYSKEMSEYVFCSPLEYAKPLSSNTLNMAHKRLGINDHNAHGWRSAFSTICYEMQKEHGFSAEVIETQLAHSIGNSVIRSYMRSDFFEERRELLRWWEGFLKTG